MAVDSPPTNSDFYKPQTQAMRLSQQDCPFCETPHARHYNGKCVVCSEREQKKRNDDFRKLIHGLTLEERVARLEAMMKLLEENPPWTEPTY